MQWKQKSEVLELLVVAENDLNRIKVVAEALFATTLTKDLVGAVRLVREALSQVAESSHLARYVTKQ